MFSLWVRVIFVCLQHWASLNKAHSRVTFSQALYNWELGQLHCITKSKIHVRVTNCFVGPSWNSMPSLFIRRSDPSYFIIWSRSFLSDDRDSNHDNPSLDLPKMARQVCLSDDQIQLFFLPSTVYIRLVNRPSRPRGSSLSSANFVFYGMLIEEWQ